MTHTFCYSQTGPSLNLRKKVASQYGVSNAILPETTTFEGRLPKLECKSSVSYNDSWEWENDPPKLGAPLLIFFKFNGPRSEIADGMKLWEHFGNHLIHFLIFGFGIASSDTSIQEFLLLYFPCIFPDVK